MRDNKKRYDFRLCNQEKSHILNVWPKFEGAKTKYNEHK